MSQLPASTLREWLWLTQAPGVSDAAVRRLLAAFGDAAGVSAAGPGGWRSVTGAEVAQALGAKRDETWEARTQATVAWLEGGRGDRHCLTLADPAYPLALRQIPDPPPLLFAHGDLAWLSGGCVAIVGSRRATAQGLDVAREFGAGLSAAGLTVVSGMALGIDGAAHEGALRGAGKTVAVVGTGPDIIYPPRHRALAAEIAREGLLLSELAPGTPALPAHFPRRNRIIAGLSLGTLVVEAAAKSGSLITARLAAEFGREVLAVPGSIRAQQSAGCHQLIRDGAQLVTSVQDILDALLPLAAAQNNVQALLGEPEPEEGDEAETASTTASLDDATRLLRALGNDPMTLDQLAARTGWPADRLQIELLNLELESRVARLPGGLFQQTGRC